MNDSTYEHETNMQKSLNTYSDPPKTTHENVHSLNAHNAVSDNNIIASGIHVNNEIQKKNEPLDISGVSYIPPTTVNTATMKLDERTIEPNYDYAYEQNITDGKTLYPEIYDYPHFGNPELNVNPQTYIDKPDNLNDNATWRNSYFAQTEKHNVMNMEPYRNEINKKYNVNYMPQYSKTDFPPIHKTTPVQYKQTRISPHIQTNGTYHGYQPNNVSYAKNNTASYVKPDAISYEQNNANSYMLPISPHHTPYEMNRTLQMNPIFRKKNGSVYKPDIPMNYMQNFQDTNYGTIPSPCIQYDQRRPIIPMSAIPPQPYIVVEEKDKRSFLQKGIDCATNGCQLNNSSTNFSNYQYLLKGVDGAPMGAILPHISYDNRKKFDVFKKLTLKVGTCLDEIVNIVVDSLHYSIEALNRNNEVKLHDLYPFYNPDPSYTRPERPTLKTGNNIIDQINIALDGSTLEKHKNVPKHTRIPIPKTVKTGHVVVDGINNILDNLLNEPISYQKYDYYSDRMDIGNKSKAKSEFSYDPK